MNRLKSLIIRSSYQHLQNSKSLELPNGIKVISEKGLPSRKEMLAKLQKQEEYDILIIGGGATGGGVAVSREWFSFVCKVYITFWTLNWPKVYLEHFRWTGRFRYTRLENGPGRAKRLCKWNKFEKVIAFLLILFNFLWMFYE